MLKICDFPYPLHDLKKEPLLKEHAQFKAKCLHVNNTDPIYDQNGLNWALPSGAADTYVVPPGFQSRHLVCVTLPVNKYSNKVLWLVHFVRRKQRNELFPRRMLSSD